jgi:hypothetical protein
MRSDVRFGVGDGFGDEAAVFGLFLLAAVSSVLLGSVGGEAAAQLGPAYLAGLGLVLGGLSFLPEEWRPVRTLAAVAGVALPWLVAAALLGQA